MCIRGMTFTMLWSSWSAGASRPLTVGLGLEVCHSGLAVALEITGTCQILVVHKINLFNNVNVACHFQCCGPQILVFVWRCTQHPDRSQPVLVLVLRSVTVVLLLLLKSRLDLTMYYISRVLSYVTDFWKPVSSSR